MKPIFLIFSVLLHASVTIVQAAEPPFKAGTGKSDITPTRAELNELPSGFTEKPLFPDGVTQPLWAKALATRVGDRTLLLITVDLGSTPLWLSDVMREELSKKCSLPRDAIVVCSTHNHSAPPIREGRAYTRRLAKQAIAAGEAAVANLKPARIGATKGYLSTLAYNSRLPITDETPAAACPDRERHRGGCMFAREHTLGRAGGRPVDHEVGVIRIDDARGQPLAVLFHYNCHPATVIEGPTLHGDFPGFAAARIEQHCPGATALFLVGALGNAHPRYFFTDVEHARLNGEELADEVLRVLPEIDTASEVQMGRSSEAFDVERVAYPTERLKRLLGYFQAYLQELEKDPQACWIGAGPDTINLPPRFPTQARRNMVLPLIRYCEDKLAARRGGETEDLKPKATEIQVFRWNDIALCLHQWELFYQTGFEVKRRSPLRYTFPVSLSNTGVGYIAPQDEFDLGGYQVVTNPMYNKLPGMWSPENCDRLVERFRAVMQKMLSSR